MKLSTVYRHVAFPFVIAVLGMVMTPGAAAQDSLNVYAPMEVSPAIEEAALVFSNRGSVEVKVASGAAMSWLADAEKAADLVFTSAEFMMVDLLRSKALPVDPVSVTPLYVRPSFILVRPGNPRNIRDFPDLLQPGVKVMTVCHSGETSLWQEMTDKAGSVETVRSLHRNVVHCPADSTEAMRMWREKEDIDAWLAWNVWHIPLRHRAELVPISRTYQIFRQCSVALTPRGKSRPAATQFVKFLATQEAAQIFESWGWERPLPDQSPLKLHDHICVVCAIEDDKWEGSVGAGFVELKKLVREYESLGIPATSLHISAIVDGDAAYWMLKDEAYCAVADGAASNPNKSIIHELVAAGISVELSAQTMAERGWKPEQVLPEVKIVSSAHTRQIDLELKGYVPVRF